MINTALLKEQLKRFWGLSALLFIWFAFTIILPLSNSRRLSHALAELLWMRSFPLIVAVLFAPLIVVIVLFSFQNQTKSVISMYSYPLTRNQILATNALAGMILLTLPLLLFSYMMVFPIQEYYHILFISTQSPSVPSSIIPANPHSGAMLNSVLVMSGFFLRVSFSMLFYLAWYIVAATLSGNSIITILLCIALPLLPVLLPVFTIAIFNFYVFGFYLDVLLYRFPFYMHPFLYFEGLRDSDSALFLRTLSYFVIIIALIVFSIFTTNRRAQERSGDSIVFPYVKNVLIFILSVCGLLLMGLLFLDMFQEIFAMYIGFAIGFFIAYCIAQMIAEKTFNILSKMKDFVKYGGIAFGILLFIVLSVRSDMFGYERRVPHSSDIVGIQMTSMRTFDVPTLDELLVKDIDIIHETMALHQAIINERNEFRYFDNIRRSHHSPSLSILYKLTNGNFLTRTYILPESIIESNDIGKLLIRSRYSVSLLIDRPDLIESINLYSSLLPNVEISEHDHIVEFVDAFMKDLENGIVFESFKRLFTDVRFSFVAEIQERDQYWLRRMSSFRLDNREQSHIYNWILANGFVSDDYCILPCDDYCILGYCWKIR